MSKEIIINAERKQTRIAIVEKGKLAELHIEDSEHVRTLGDIYVGRVRYTESSLRAVFVDIGQEQHAFLHFSDISGNTDAMLEFVRQDKPQVEVFYPTWLRYLKRQGEGHVSKSISSRSKFPRRGSPDNFKRDQRVLVRVIKEPIRPKSSRVSTDVSLAGRFLILVPLNDVIAVSRKIVSGKERRRLKELMKMLVPQGYGVIVRTVASGKNAKSLDTDLNILLRRWRKIEEKIVGPLEKPLRVHQDLTLASSIIRDLFSSDYDRILIDNRKIYHSIKNYVQAVAPRMAQSVQLYSNKKPIFDYTGLRKEIDTAFDRQVTLPSGGYLYIERTEAMYVIDVNSGRSGRGMDPEQKSLKVNLEAARVVARQVRLRDIGGIIVVDFISMREGSNKRRVFKELYRQLQADRATTAVLPMSDFGLIEFTRQRIRSSATTMHVEDQEDSMDDNMSMAVQDLDTWKKSVEQELEFCVLRSEGKNDVCLRVHPFTASYLDRGFFGSIRRQWQRKYRVTIKLESDEALDPMEFKCVNAGTEQEIRMAEEKTSATPAQNRGKKASTIPQKRPYNSGGSKQGAGASQRNHMAKPSQSRTQGRPKGKSQPKKYSGADRSVHTKSNGRSRNNFSSSPKKSQVNRTPVSTKKS